MMVPQHLQVFLAVGATDMRKSINGLCLLVQMHLALDPFAGHLFAFCNRRRNMVKILYWERNGYCLWQKRLERHRFVWPESPHHVLSLKGRELLQGLRPDRRLQRLRCLRPKTRNYHGGLLHARPAEVP
jgi:transposase